MFTRIDHVMICVHDLELGIEQYRKIGFDIHPGGNHPGKGTHNAIAFNAEDYVELLAIRDPVEQQAASRVPGTTATGLSEFLAKGEGIRYALEKGVFVVTTTRAGSGRIAGQVRPAGGTGQTARPSDLRIEGEDLAPLKARILLMVALTKTSDPAEIQRIFLEY